MAITSTGSSAFSAVINVISTGYGIQQAIHVAFRCQGVLCGCCPVLGGVARTTGSAVRLFAYNTVSGMFE